MASPPCTENNPRSIDSLDTKSNAPMPSTESTVLSGLESVSTCKMWPIHSHPALVVRAYWNGAVACSTAGANSWAMVRDTSRLMKSPTTMPLTPPDGFCRAVILPMRIASNTGAGVVPRANSWHMLQNRSQSLVDSKRGRKCSAVVPEGPPAAHLKFVNSRT